MLNKTVSFLKENKKIIYIIIIILVLLIISIVLLANKTKHGNTDGNLNSLGFTVKKGNWIYYLGIKNSNTDGIYKIKENGKEIKKLSSDYGLYLNNYENNIYFLDMTSDKYNIVKADKNIEGKQIIINDVDNAKFSIVDNFIFYIKGDKLYKAKINGEGKQILISRKINNYEIKNKYIYYSYIDDGKNIIAKVKMDGKDRQILDRDAGTEFLINKNYIYYVLENQIYKIKINGKDKVKILNLENDIQISNLNIYKNRIYYLKNEEQGTNSIYSIGINGEEEIKILDTQENFTTININNGWIYYIDKNDNGDSQIYRIKIDGTQKQEI